MESFYDDESESIGYCFWRLSIQWQRTISKELKEYNLTHTQFVILANLLYVSSGCSQNTLSKRTSIDKMTLSSTIRLLCKKGLVVIGKSTDDKRNNIINLTQEGTKIAKETVPVVEKIDREFFNKENERLTDFYSKLKKRQF